MNFIIIVYLNLELTYWQ